MTKATFNASRMKDKNKFIVLNYIRQGGLSRADISRLTGLTRASITYIVDSLVEDGLVVETGFNQPKIGKRSVLLSINPSASYVIGVSIQRGSLRLTVLGLSTKIYEDRIIYDETDSLKESLEIINQLITLFLKKYGKKIIGIGVTSPGPVDSKKGLILNPTRLNKWHYFDICNYLEQRYKIPCYLNKDINSYACLEKTFNSELADKSFIEIMSERGIGSAIVMDGEMFVGNGFGCELGHISIDINGRLCECGHHGCLEKYASIICLLSECKEEGIGDFSSWEEVIDTLYTSDAEKKAQAVKVVNRMVLYLGSGLVAFQNLLNINNIVFSGHFAYRPTLFFNQLDNYISTRMLCRNNQSINIYASKVKDIEAKAAGNVILEKYFNGELKLCQK